MSETFNPINTQEEFNAAIKDRLNRERQKYADYDNLKEQVGTLTTERDTYKQQVDERDLKLYPLDQVTEALIYPLKGKLKGKLI